MTLPKQLNNFSWIRFCVYLIDICVSFLSKFALKDPAQASKNIHYIYFLKILYEVQLFRNTLLPQGTWQSFSYSCICFNDWTLSLSFLQ